MKQIHTILLIFFFLAAYSCMPSGKVTDLDFEEVSFASSSNSIENYSTTLFPIVKSNCGACHGSTQSPRFAVSDLSESHQVLLDFNLVDLENPSSSRLVSKVLSGHQGFSAQLATDIEDAIANWAQNGTVAPVDPIPDPTDETDENDNGDSIQIFETTLFPLIKDNCSGCHGINQSPLFALPDATQAHNNLITFSLVNLDNPSESRIVQKIRGGHRSFNESLSNNIESAIISWKEQLGDSTTPEPPTLVATFTSIHQLILVPKCLGCHSPGGTRSKEDYTNYQTTIQTGKIKAGDPEDSEMYQECVDGEMPRNAAALNIEELNIIRDWIQMGAQNN